MALGFSVGPMALLIIQRSITKGMHSGVATSLGISFADFTFGIIAFGIGASLFRLLQQYEEPFSFFSSFVLIGLAVFLFLSAWRAYQTQKVIEPVKAIGRDFLSAYLLTMHNPITIGLYLGFVGQVTDIQTASAIFLLASCLFIGSLMGQVFIAGIAWRFRGLFRRPAAIFTLNALSAACIAAFGIMNLATT